MREMHRLRPVLDRVVIRVAERDEYSTTGRIVLPGSRVGRPNKGEVVRVGPGRKLPSGERVEPQVKPGDLVLFDPYLLEWVEDQPKAMANPIGQPGKLAVIKEINIDAVLNADDG